MSATKQPRNTLPETCTDCHAALPAGEGFREDEWSMVVRCGPCNRSYLEKRDRLMAIRMREGAVLAQVIKRLPKRFQIIRMLAGYEYSSGSCSVLIGGQEYILNVMEKQTKGSDE